MAKDIYEENKELKRTLYTIEKALLDFRLTQLDLPLERVNVPSVFATPNTVPYTVSTCSCGDSCNCDEEKEVLKEQIEVLKSKLAKYEYQQDVKIEVPTGFPGDIPADDEEEIIYENGFATVAEPTPEVEPAEPEPVKKERKPRKERGGTVFTDFKTLSLDNNDYEGNSIVYSKKGI